MRFAIRFRIPETEEESKCAWIEPKNSIHRKILKEKLHFEVLKVEAKGKENIFLFAMEALYKLHTVFTGSVLNARVFDIDFNHMKQAYAEKMIIEEKIKSGTEEERKFATEVRNEAFKRRNEILKKE